MCLIFQRKTKADRLYIFQSSFGLEALNFLPWMHHRNNDKKLAYNSLHMFKLPNNLKMANSTTGNALKKEITKNTHPLQLIIIAFTAVWNGRQYHTRSQ